VSRVVRVYWNQEGEDEDGELIGTLLVSRPTGLDSACDGWVRRSVAQAYAEAHRYELVSDE
jgi:hypothetical protein